VTDSDLTHAILREIRDAVQTTNSRLDETNVELRTVKTELIELKGEVRERLDIANERLAVVEHTVKDAAGQIVMLARYVKNKHETAIDDLRERVTRLEAKASG
jgi:uncharacterized coiled-coil DUF342 family protein